MIIFYDKTTGRIIGSIDGRVHPPQHLKTWMGDKKTTERLIVEWKPTGKEKKTSQAARQMVLDHVDPQGNKFYREEIIERVIVKKEWEPQHEQQDIFTDLDRRKTRVFDYRVNIKTKRLEKISQSET